MTLESKKQLQEYIIRLYYASRAKRSQSDEPSARHQILVLLLHWDDGAVALDNGREWPKLPNKMSYVIDSTCKFIK